MKKFIFVSWLCLPVLAGTFNSSRAVQYEPPINVVFIVHVENLNFPGSYPTRITFLEWLQQLALSRPNPFKLTILMNGDFAEYVCYNGDQPFFSQLEAEGHELGTHAHNIIQIEPLRWLDVSDGTHRYGISYYDHQLTEQIWFDARHWVDSLTFSNQTICAVPFLCSTEAQLMTENNFLSDPGKPVRLLEYRRDSYFKGSFPSGAALSTLY